MSVKHQQLNENIVSDSFQLLGDLLDPVFVLKSILVNHLQVNPKPSGVKEVIVNIRRAFDEAVNNFCNNVAILVIEIMWPVCQCYIMMLKFCTVK